MQSFSAHPVAELFPLLSEAELNDLAADIKANGLLHPVTLDAEGKLLDGRNRIEACRRAGVEVKTERLPASANPIQFIVSMNLKRRHLDESQRALIAAKIANLGKGRPKETAEISAIVSQSDAAAMLNVSRGSVQNAKAIIAKGAPELVEAVKRGRIKVGEGAKIVKLPIAEQRRRVALPKAARKAEASSASPGAARDNAIIDLVRHLQRNPAGFLNDVAAIIADEQARLSRVSEYQRRHAARKILAGLGLREAQMNGEEPGQSFNRSAPALTLSALDAAGEG